MLVSVICGIARIFAIYGKKGGLEERLDVKEKADYSCQSGKFNLIRFLCSAGKVFE